MVYYWDLWSPVLGKKYLRIDKYLFQTQIYWCALVT